MTGPLLLIVLALLAALSFVSVRRFEAAKGTRFFDAQRAVLDTRAEEVWHALVTGGAPLAWRTYAQVTAHTVGHEVVRIAVEVVRAVERPLARLSYKMRVSAPKVGAAPVSDFLKTITPDKGAGDLQHKSV
jgi:hypothetical protein